jgi:hypothetical protein
MIIADPECYLVSDEEAIHVTGGGPNSAGQTI